MPAASPWPACRANRHDHIKRVLDNGAHGVVVPMVNSREEAEEAVAACSIRRVGNRSVGGSAHALNFDATAAGLLRPGQRRNPHRSAMRAHPGGARRRVDLLGARHRRHLRRPQRPGRQHAHAGRQSRRPADATNEALKHILATCKRHNVAAGFTPVLPKRRACASKKVGSSSRSAAN